MTWHRDALAYLRAAGPAVLVTVDRALGSTPRKAGTSMLVGSDAVFGTIGGGTLEFDAINSARRSLQSGELIKSSHDISLGPDLGQCCGGRVTLSFALLNSADTVLLEELQDRDLEDHTPVWLFGAGHVGAAIVRALEPLPFKVTWVDSREDIFPAQSSVEMKHAICPELEIANAPDGAFALILTHSHAEDFDIADAALRHSGLGFIGLIGSATKSAKFRKNLAGLGHSETALARLTCPIGDVGINDKDPAVIAASVAVQMIREREAQMNSADQLRVVGH